MAIDNSFSTADVNQILNSPGIFYFRKYGTSDSHTRAIFTNGASFSYTPTVNTQAFDDTGDVYDYIGEESGEISFSYGKPMDIDFMSNLSNGLFTRTDTSSGTQTVVDQVIAGGWADKDPIVLELIAPNDQYLVADGEPGITSVTASTAGVLAADDDYTIIKDGNSRSGYAIVLNTAGSAGVTTSEDVTIVFNDPVNVVLGSKLSGGGISNYGAVEGYFETVLRDGTPARIDFYRGFYNGNINITFGTENDPVAAVTDVTISLKKDTNRTAGDQIFAIQLGA